MSAPDVSVVKHVPEYADAADIFAQDAGFPALFAGDMTLYWWAWNRMVSTTVPDLEGQARNGKGI
ncbi:MAG: hypothetical protein HN742_07220 [Lentisphaerae bacterium]|nr:hypothetical protein [Lentisphaerota bacterium]MBT4814167.1 hypothetical protein [Lentisphaerota bacterium]MBT5604521.1 hypothetical protein [Lentisphaerota bacterium]MBT7057677.1 hypothetical protein [Lentisphaerota bacterium]MBT7841644.1 hypothetical protein [Lentisphaerota bacterium]